MAVNYSALSDDELVGLFRSGDGVAGSELAVRYRPLVKRCTRPYFLVGGDSEDLIQEGMIGLVSSIQSYQPGGSALFRSYAELCVKRRILSAIKAAARFKHMPLNYRLSLDEIYSVLQTLPEAAPIEHEEFVYERPDHNDFEIERDDDGAFVVFGPLVDLLERNVVLDDYDSLAYMQKTLLDFGVIAELRKKGAKDGDTVVIGEIEFDFVD